MLYVAANVKHFGCALSAESVRRASKASNNISPPKRAQIHTHTYTSARAKQSKQATAADDDAIDVKTERRSENKAVILQQKKA